jgi:hypothetical protein
MPNPWKYTVAQILDFGSHVARILVEQSGLDSQQSRVFFSTAYRVAVEPTQFPIQLEVGPKWEAGHSVLLA